MATKLCNERRSLALAAVILSVALAGVESSARPRQLVERGDQGETATVNCVTPDQRRDIEAAIARRYPDGYESAGRAASGQKQYAFFPQAGILWQDLYTGRRRLVHPSCG